MSKKSFKDNPALQFMSRPEEVAREEKPIEVREIREVKENLVNSYRPAAPMVFEAKSKRFNMLIRPSVFASLKEISENRGTSINDLINTIVENYIAEIDGK